MNPALLMALQLLQSLPALISAGVEVKGLIETQSAKLTDMVANSRDPSAQDWADLNAQIFALRGQLHAPAM